MLPGKGTRNEGVANNTHVSSILLYIIVPFLQVKRPCQKYNTLFVERLPITQSHSIYSRPSKNMATQFTLGIHRLF